MYRPSVSAIALLTLALLGGACSPNDPTPPTTPTPPEAVNEPDWTGTLTVNGAAVQHFIATDIGTVTAILSDLQPNEDATLDIGLDLGTWSGTSCTIKISNPKVGIGSGVVGFANGPGELCARVYDAGYLTGPVTFTVKISHY